MKKFLSLIVLSTMTFALFANAGQEGGGGKNLKAYIDSHSLPVSATLKPSPLVDYKIESLAGDFATVFMGQSLVCNTKVLPQGDYYASADSAIFSSIYANDKNQIHGQVGIGKETFLTAPQGDANSISTCTVALRLYYKLKGQERGSSLQIAAVQTKDHFLKDMTQDFLNASQGAYKLIPVIKKNAEGKSCYLLLNKWENGTWVNKNEDHIFTCPRK